MSTGSLLSLNVLTPEGSILEEEALYSVNVPLADGSPIGLKPGHAPLIAETIQGSIRFRSLDGEHQIELHAGVLDIRDNQVIILTPGKVSTTPLEITEESENDYTRLMTSLIEKLDLNPN
ncbi:MAG: F0F1 ATP synthase subunit epsilon [Chloroflexota bacterium]|nr:F0F1 ATP synthase subunit epsilon [Chloroflexota bacterium]